MLEKQLQQREKQVELVLLLLVASPDSRSLVGLVGGRLWVGVHCHGVQAYGLT